MKRIVVTGGSGRLGVKVIDELIARGVDVLSVDLNRPEKPQCPFLPADLTEAAVVQDVLSRRGYPSGSRPRADVAASAGHVSEQRAEHLERRTRGRDAGAAAAGVCVAFI